MHNHQIPAQGPLLAVDYGDARIGLAISDGLQISANPLPALAHKQLGLVGVLKELTNYLQSRRIVGIVLGMPLSIDGTKGPAAQKVEQFKDSLQQTTHVPICFMDERYTSNEADSFMQEKRIPAKKRKQMKDSIAAAIILESFLQSRANL